MSRQGNPWFRQPKRVPPPPTGCSSIPPPPPPSPRSLPTEGTTCPECGGIVADQQTHDLWHAVLHQVVGLAHRGSGDSWESFGMQR